MYIHTYVHTYIHTYIGHLICPYVSCPSDIKRPICSAGNPGGIFVLQNDTHFGSVLSEHANTYTHVLREKSDNKVFVFIKILIFNTTAKVTHL